jgi:hypothetical protein
VRACAACKYTKKRNFVHPSIAHGRRIKTTSTLFRFWLKPRDQTSAEKTDGRTDGRIAQSRSFKNMLLSGRSAGGMLSTTNRVVMASAAA